MKHAALPPNAEWCPICYGWVENAVGDTATDHHLDHHRTWLLTKRDTPHPKSVTLGRR